MKKRLFAGSLAVLAAVSALAATTAGASSKGDQLVGAGSSFVSPLVSQWQKDYPPKTGVNIVYSPSGSGAGIAAISGAFGRLRRLGRTADARPVHRLQGLLPDSVGARRRRHHGARQDERARSAEDLRPGAGPDLPRRDQDLGCAGDQGAEPRHHVPERADRAGLPLRRLGHVVRLHRLSRRRSVPTWKSKIGVSTQPAFPTGVGAKGSSGVSGVVSKTDGSDRLRGHRVRRHEQDPGDGGQERRRQVPHAGTRVDQGSRQRVQRRYRRTTRCTSSTRRRRRGVPTRSAPTRT